MGLFKGREAKPYRIVDKQIRCEICHHENFFKREGKIQTTAMTFFELDWANASATCLVCEQCGYVHWFLPP